MKNAKCEIHHLTIGVQLYNTVAVVGDRSFAAAGPRLWNSLPVDVQSAPSLTTFRQKLKTRSFRQSYPGIAFRPNYFTIVVLEVSFT